MLKKLILFSFLLISTFAEAETLFYKKDGSPITPQEHEVIYKIMLETQFPMSLMYGQYADDEIKVMNEKIKAHLPNSGIEATFIPTTLYELFALRFIYENIENGQLTKATNGFLSVDKNKKIICGSVYYLKIPIHAFKNANLKHELMQWHLTINNYIVKLNVLPLSFDQSMKAVGLPIKMVFERAINISVSV